MDDVEGSKEVSVIGSRRGLVLPEREVIKEDRWYIDEALYLGERL